MNEQWLYTLPAVHIWLAISTADWNAAFLQSCTMSIDLSSLVWLWSWYYVNDP